MLTHIRTISPFDALSDDEVESFASHAVVRKFKKNTLVIYQGDETDSLYIIREGEMKVYVEDDNGKELIVRMLGEGDSFGELALLGEFPRSANVMATTDGSAFVISKASYMDCIRNNPEISISLIRSLANMVRETTGELSHIALSDVYGRLVHVLEKYASEQEGRHRVPKFTHREIASMIGSSREMVSKILKDLEKGGYISVDTRHYVLEKKLPARW
jgi:CRP/FNR family cyclic AMP-dependent transcriptional regulator